MAEQNAYAILNLRKGATDQEIKQAYVEQVKRYDPEKHTEHFMKIQKAYEKLRDPKARAREDLLTYNSVPGEFAFSAEERADQQTGPDVTAQVRELEQALQADPGNEALRSKLALGYMLRSYRNAQKKLWQEAIKDWLATLKLDPTHQRAKNNLIFAYIFLANSYALHDLLDEAIRLWEFALQMEPDSTPVIQNLAIASEKAGDRERAARYWSELVRRWKESLEREPDNEYFKALIIEAHKHHGGKALQAVPTPETKAEAIESYREVLKINPADFEAQFNLAVSLIEQAKFTEAIDELKNLQASHPKNLDVMNQLGWAYLNAGHFEMAFSTWRRAMVMDPKNITVKESITRARLAVGKKLKEGGHYTQALVHFKELQKLIPNQWEIHYQIADCLLRKGDRRSALTEFQKVLDLDPKNKEAKRAISDIRMRA